MKIRALEICRVQKNHLRQLNKLAQSASKIGVPIYAPLLDDVDKRSLAASDVWGFFEDSILNASKRYQTDSVAALRISNYAGKLVVTYWYY